MIIKILKDKEEKIINGDIFRQKTEKDINNKNLKEIIFYNDYKTKKYDFFVLNEIVKGYYFKDFYKIKNNDYVFYLTDQKKGLNKIIESK